MLKTWLPSAGSSEVDRLAHLSRVGCICSLDAFAKVMSILFGEELTFSVSGPNLRTLAMLVLAGSMAKGGLHLLVPTPVPAMEPKKVLI